MKLFNDVFTEDDNVTYCWARIASAISILSFLGFTGYNLYLNHTFPMSEFASGLMQILTGSAAIIGAKQITSTKK